MGPEGGNRSHQSVLLLLGASFTETDLNTAILSLLLFHIMNEKTEVSLLQAISSHPIKLSEFSFLYLLCDFFVQCLAILIYLSILAK